MRKCQECGFEFKIHSWFKRTFKKANPNRCPNCGAFGSPASEPNYFIPTPPVNWAKIAWEGRDKITAKSVTQVKIFNGNGNNEAEVNAWLAENPNIKVLDIKIQPLYDFYTGFSPPQICNQWLATTVIYEIVGGG